MFLLKDYTFRIVILSILYNSSEGFSSSIYQSIISASDVSLSLHNSSIMSPEDVRTIIGTLENHKKVNLQFLYDADQEETVRSVANESEDFTGFMFFENDEKVETLKLLLDYAFVDSIVLVFCSPVNIVNIFGLIRLHRLKSHRVGWVLFTRGEKEALETAVGVEGLIHEGTKVTLIDKDSGGSFQFFSAHVDAEGIIRFHYKGKWAGSSVDEDQEQVQRLLTTFDISYYTNMRGREMIVGACEIWPFFFNIKEFNPGATGGPQGIEPTILRTLGTLLNFTFRAIVPADRKWGLPYPNGTVTGMIGLAARREAHFSVSFIGVTYPRITVVDYTSPHYREYVGLFSRSPKQKNRALAVLAPFTLQVWMSIFAFTLIMGLIVYLHNLLSSTYYIGSSSTDFQEFFFNVFRSLVVQGNRLETKLPSKRLIFISWYIFSFLVAALYSGMLTAVLAIPAYEKPVDSLEDLPRAVGDGFDIGLVPETANEYMFRGAKEGIYKQTWDLFNHKDMSKSYVATTAKGIERVLERKYVFIGPKTLSEILAMRLGKQKFHFGRSAFYPVGVAIVCPPGVPYNPVFSGFILRMYEGGLVIKWKDDEIRKISLPAVDEEEARISAFTLTQLQAAFIVVILGFLIAFITLVLEQISFRCF